MTYDESIILTAENWQQLSPGEKLEALQAIEDRMALESDRLACPVESRPLYADGNSVTLGLYDPATGRICINSSQLEPGSRYGDDPRMMVETCLHEGRHAYQDQAVKGIADHSDKAQVESWRENFKDYITFEENPRAYYSQPVEADARAFAHARYEMMNEERTQLREQSVSYGIGT